MATNGTSPRARLVWADRRLTRRAAASLAVALAVAAGALATLVLVSSGSEAPSPWSPAEVLAIARRVGRANGDPHPTRIATVRSTRARAVNVITFGNESGVEDPSEPVEVLTMYGRFTIEPPYPPSSFHGRVRPAWGWITLVRRLGFDGGREFGSESADKRPPLEQLGRVRYISATGSTLAG